MKEIDNENIKVVKEDRLITTDTLKDNYLVDFAGIQKEYGLNERQIKAAFLLSTSTLTKTAIAKKLGINRNTLYAWLKKPGFLQLYNELCAYALKSMQGRAIATLGNIMGNDEHKDQFQASKFIINTNMGVVDGPTVAQKRDATEDLIELLSSDSRLEEVQVNTADTYDPRDEIVDPIEVGIE